MRIAASSSSFVHCGQHRGDFALFPLRFIRVLRLRHLRSLQSPRFLPRRFIVPAGSFGSVRNIRRVCRVGAEAVGKRLAACAKRSEANRPIEPVAASVRIEVPRAERVRSDRNALAAAGRAGEEGRG